jgi:hypothetical protein
MADSGYSHCMKFMLSERLLCGEERYWVRCCRYLCKGYIKARCRQQQQHFSSMEYPSPTLLRYTLITSPCHLWNNPPMLQFNPYDPGDTSYQ